MGLVGNINVLYSLNLISEAISKAVILPTALVFTVNDVTTKRYDKNVFFFGLQMCLILLNYFASLQNRKLCSGHNIGRIFFQHI